MTLDEQVHVISKDKLTLQKHESHRENIPSLYPSSFHYILVHVQMHAPFKGKNAGRWPVLTCYLYCNIPK